MNLIISLMVGLAMGWIATRVLRVESQHALGIYLLTGAVGGLIGGLVLSPLMGVAAISHSAITVGNTIVSLSGAVMAVAVLTMIPARRAR